MPFSNKYKNTLKGLRKNNSPTLVTKVVVKSVKNNSYACLDDFDDILDEFASEVSESNEFVASKKEIAVLDCLPEEMINNILEYLPKNTRLAILKNKYNKKFMLNKLEEIPETYEILSKLYKCAIIAKDVLDYAFKKSAVLASSSSWLKWFKEDKDKEFHKYAESYKKNFIKMILAAVKHYTKVYKIKDESVKSYRIYNNFYVYISRIECNNWNKKAIEEMMFRLYANLKLL